MPKFPSIPRLSIVVPLRESAAAFEATLVSVLQNRPDSCEVIVAHDGRYDDPFDLSEEIRFVVAGNNDWLALLEAAAGIAKGRFVHVMADGHTASEGWTDVALSGFERGDVGSVAAVVCDPVSGMIEHAGWCRSASSAFHLVAGGNAKMSSRDLASVEGPLLSASFWRRDLLRSVTSCYRGNDTLEASMVTSLTAAAAQWRCVIAEQCIVTGPESNRPTQSAVDGNHRRLQAIADTFGTGGWGKSCTRGLQTLVAGSFLPSAWFSAVRRATSPMASASVAKCIRKTSVPEAYQHPATLALPAGTTVRVRRAA